MILVSSVLVSMRASVEPHELPTQSTSPFLSVPMRRGPCDHGSGPAERRHVLRRLVDRDLLALDVELAEAATARIDVEPEVSIGVAGEPVRGGGGAGGVVDLEVLHLAGLGVDLADGDVFVR